ncbi:aldo/keto reductase [Enterococcus innesii]|uniref:aldo/keto reductase n=1 Tax=Enterococcus TaxID=1350 RepID=UPI0009C0D741|nr:MULTISPECIES: aldo/keto reductase [Enterococcus]MIM11612.1 aldo/keto reductase [Listeria monocytogenes]OQO87046.1 aldo/keto reductase [Enterococcus casseliflavus]MEB5952227.1 aldo/keto reductase [Enterococcus innesii]MIV58081.1 aldo/keto reductase [Listeria monocytogenes]TPR58778.1 aldo/keto reductase [Enterococcus sp. OL5]
MKRTLNKQSVLAVGMGTWHMGDDPAKEKAEIDALQAGIKAGAAVIDTAEMYGEGNAETLVGKAIQPFTRGNLYLISKVYPWNASADELPKALDRSLARLGTDYLDLYLLHWRGDVPLAETVDALEAAKASGKIRAWGVSNFDVADMEELLRLENGDQCAANQVLYNLGARGIEYDLLPWQAEAEIPVIAYSPIAQGDRLGHHFKNDEVLKELAEAKGCTIFQLLLAWTLRQPHVLAIPQTSDSLHMLQNIEAAKIIFSKSELAAIDARFPAPTKKQPLAMI